MLDSRPIQPQLDPLPHTTQVSYLAGKTVQPTIVKDSTSASRFKPKASLAKMQMNKTVQQQVQFEKFAPPNQQPWIKNQTRRGTLPQPVTPSANYSAPKQSQYAPTRNEAVSLAASLPKLKLAEFTGELEWPEWSGFFLSTVHAANDTSLKMNHLKTLVTGKAKDAIAELGYTEDMYDVAWNTSDDQFGRPQVVVNVQRRGYILFCQSNLLILHLL